MLLEFSVKNYLSIKEKIVLSAIANKGNEHNEILIEDNKDMVLPSIAAFGANASGKSNIFKALTSAIMLVRMSNNFQVDTHTGLIPFLFDDKYAGGKTEMDFLFINNGKKFKYGFVADNKNVYDEYLYEYKSSRPTVIFERKNINEYFFTTPFKNLEEYTEKNTHNKLFMCTATAWNCEATKDAYLWFAEKTDTYDQGVIRDNQYFEYLDRNKDNNKAKEFLLSMLKHAEINIVDYEFESSVLENPSIPFPPGISIDKSVFNEIKQFRLETIHEVKRENGDVQRYTLSFEQESVGTKLLFAYGPIIMEALENGKTIAIDELGNSLHIELSKYLIDIFNDKKLNKKGAQLIFNTHDVNLLSLDIFRRDQIYFVEKDTDTHESKLYPLSDFSPRKAENIRKSYLEGKYGALPNVTPGVDYEGEG